MEHTPEEYGQYWGGAIRIAAGVLIVILAYRWLVPFFDHPTTGATLFGYFVFGLAALAGTYAAVLGLAVVIKAAVQNA